MKYISLLICSAIFAGCAGHRDVGVINLSKPGFYTGPIVPLSAHADIDSSVSKAEVKYVQKIVVDKWFRDDVPIDSIHKKREADGDIIEVRRNIDFWRFKHSADGKWQLLASGVWVI
jgi:hypothetical protein